MKGPSWRRRLECSGSGSGSGGGQGGPLEHEKKGGVVT